MWYTIDSLVTDYFLWKEKMANITRIKASGSSPQDKPKTEVSKVKDPKAKLKKLTKVHSKLDQKSKKPIPKWLKIITFPILLIFKPFTGIGRYVKNSWAEIRQVRWPNRKSTWGMVSAILLYTVIFVTFITLLDALFKYLFNNFLK